MREKQIIPSASSRGLQGHRFLTEQQLLPCSSRSERRRGQPPGAQRVKETQRNFPGAPGFRDRARVVFHSSQYVYMRKDIKSLLKC